VADDIDPGDMLCVGMAAFRPVARVMEHNLADLLTFHGIYTAWAIEMLTYDQDAEHDAPWSFLWKILAGASLIGLLVFWFTHGPLIDHIGREYPIVACLALWTVGMLSYHQDASRHDPWWGWAFVSQSWAVTSLINIVVLGFTHRSWPNFLIAPPLIWLHIQFTKRWWARPGVWW
jgi:hypothetical protein